MNEIWNMLDAMNRLEETEEQINDLEEWKIIKLNKREKKELSKVRIN